MTRLRRALAAALLTVLCASGASPLRAAPPEDPSPEALEDAKARFREGIELLQEHRYERALERFLQSRKLVPSYENTRNAASCLDILGRFDEALEMYEVLLADFGAKLSPEERAQVKARMAELDARLGTLVIEANVGGEVRIDDRPRGALPLARPLRVMGGWRRIRVTRSGYLPFETSVDVTPGVPMLVEARLKLAPRRPDAPLVQRPPNPELARARSGWFLEVFGGYAAGPNLGSDAEDAAAATCLSGQCPGAGGPLVGLRGGYLLEAGLAFEVGGAFLDLSSSFQRSIDIPDPDDPGVPLGRYQLDHRLRLRQSLFEAGVSYRLPIAWRISALARMTLALASSQAADAVSGVAIPAEGPAPAPAVISGRDRTLRSTVGLVIPEVGLEAAWGPLRAGLSVGLLISPSQGPRYGRRLLGVTGGCTSPGIGAALPLGCAADSSAIAYERAYGPFLLWVPQLSVAASF